MTRRAYRLIVGAYAFLALGAIVTLILLSRQAKDISATNRQLVGAAVAYCQAGIQPDAQETVVIDQISRGTYNGKLDPICLRIQSRLERP